MYQGRIRKPMYSLDLSDHTFDLIGNSTPQVYSTVEGDNHYEGHMAKETLPQGSQLIEYVELGSPGSIATKVQQPVVLAIQENANVLAHATKQSLSISESFPDLLQAFTRSNGTGSSVESATEEANDAFVFVKNSQDRLRSLEATLRPGKGSAVLPPADKPRSVFSSNESKSVEDFTRKDVKCEVSIDATSSSQTINERADQPPTSLMSLLIEVEAFDGLSTEEMTQLSHKAVSMSCGKGLTNYPYSDEAVVPIAIRTDLEPVKLNKRPGVGGYSKSTITRLEDLSEYGSVTTDDESEAEVESQQKVEIGSPYESYESCARPSLPTPPWRRALQVEQPTTNATTVPASVECPRNKLSLAKRHRFRTTKYQAPDTLTADEHKLYANWPVFYRDGISRPAMLPKDPWPLSRSSRSDTPHQVKGSLRDSGYESNASAESDLESRASTDREIHETTPADIRAKQTSLEVEHEHGYGHESRKLDARVAKIEILSDFNVIYSAQEHLGMTSRRSSTSSQTTTFVSEGSKYHLICHDLNLLYWSLAATEAALDKAFLDKIALANVTNHRSNGSMNTERRRKILSSIAKGLDTVAATRTVVQDKSADHSFIRFSNRATVTFDAQDINSVRAFAKYVRNEVKATV